MINILQNYLRQFGPDKLKEEYFIKHKQHYKYPNLYLFKYDQINSDFTKSIVKVCRGIILNRDNDWKPVCYPYEKFFNWGEKEASQIDWRHYPNIYEKLDGSLISLWYYDYKWHVSTSGTPDAMCYVGGTNFLFRDLFWKVWNELGYKLPDVSKCAGLLDFTYMFELMTPFNRVVVDHKKNDIKLHGARGLISLQERDPDYIVQEFDLNWKTVKKYNFKNLFEIIDMTKTMKGIEQEGFVVCDYKFNRIKIKCDDYVKLHHCVSGMSTRKMIEIIQKNETEEILNYFPSYKEMFAEIKEKYENLIIETEKCYDNFKNIENQKDFALAVKDLSYSSALFNVRNMKNKSFREFYSQMSVKKLEIFLGLNNVNLINEE